MADKKIRQLLEENLESHIHMYQHMMSTVEVKESIEYAANIVLSSIQSGGAIYFCGNGGSAADCQHIATEFVSRFYKERKALNAEALTVNTSSLTAIGNDYDFDRVFVRQLEAKGRKGDVIIGISTSGTSRNVMEAMQYAAEHDMHTILLTGDRGNIYDKSVYECVVRIPSEDTPRIQEGHIFVGHVIAEYVEGAIAKEDDKG